MILLELGCFCLTGVFIHATVKTLKGSSEDKLQQKLSPDHIELILHRWPGELGRPPSENSARVWYRLYTRLVCVKQGGSLDILQRVLSFPDY